MKNTILFSSSFGFHTWYRICNAATQQITQNNRSFYKSHTQPPDKYADAIQTSWHSYVD